MSTPPQVLILAPDGTPGNVPFSQLHDALSAGGKVARKVQAPDGTPGYVSVDRFNDAVKAGAKPIPFDESDKPAPGGFVQHAKQYLQQANPQSIGDVAKQAVMATLPGAGFAQQVYGAAANAPENFKAGYKTGQETGTGGLSTGAAYAAGPMVGVDPRQVERTAATGDTAGVLGDVAVPTALAVAPLGAEGALRGASAAADVAAPAIGTALRTPEGKLIPPVKIGAKLAGGAAGHMLGIPGAGELGGYLIGDKLADMLVPDRPGAATAAERRAIPVSKNPNPGGYTGPTSAQTANAVHPLNPVYGPAVPSAEQLAQGVKLSDLVGEKPSGITVVPEPRPTFAGETPNYMASVPRGTLQDLALGAKPGAAKQLQQLGQQIIYAPSGAGISNVRSSVPLSELANTGAAAAEPNYLYRIRPVGEEGVPKGAGNSPAQLTSSLEQAESWVPSKNKAGPHEIIRVDANSLKPGQTTVRPFSEDIDWHRVNQSIPESQVEVVRPHQAEVESD